MQAFDEIIDGIQKLKQKYSTSRSRFLQCDMCSAGGQSNLSHPGHSHPLNPFGSRAPFQSVRRQRSGEPGANTTKRPESAAKRPRLQAAMRPKGSWTGVRKQQQNRMQAIEQLKATVRCQQAQMSSLSRRRPPHIEPFDESSAPLVVLVQGQNELVVTPHVQTDERLQRGIYKSKEVRLAMEFVEKLRKGLEPTNVEWANKIEQRGVDVVFKSLASVLHLRTSLPARLQSLEDDVQQVRDLEGKRVAELIERSGVTEEDVKFAQNAISQIQKHLFGPKMNDLMSMVQECEKEFTKGGLFFWGIFFVFFWEFFLFSSLASWLLWLLWLFAAFAASWLL
eukprot:s754_g13.t1